MIFALFVHPVTRNQNVVETRATCLGSMSLFLLKKAPTLVPFSPPTAKTARRTLMLIDSVHSALASMRLIRMIFPWHVVTNVIGKLCNYETLTMIDGSMSAVILN